MVLTLVMVKRSKRSCWSDASGRELFRHFGSHGVVEPSLFFRMNGDRLKLHPTTDVVVSVVQCNKKPTDENQAANGANYLPSRKWLINGNGTGSVVCHGKVITPFKLS